jgi:putative colanic acid biosynthesis UDP-glucose lipid carrier transferase
MKLISPLRFTPAQGHQKELNRLRLLRVHEIHLLQVQAQRINRSILKRGLDIALSAFLILFFLPALIVIALAIKLTSPGPVIFRQQRYGAGGRKFPILKFRTMHVLESEGPFHQAIRDDSRITPIGGWLRRSSMDELPQLFNVLTGSMSLVGPRPHAIAMDDYYGAFIADFGARHLVRPGLTGLAQVNGFRGPTEQLEAIVGRFAHDVTYIRKWSPAVDIVILLRTPAALFGRNAI